VNEKILFVDDEPEVLNGYKRSLHREFDIDNAAKGTDAIIRLSDSSGNYAVVISDMRMHGMDGIQLLSRVHKLPPNAVRVMLTAWGETHKPEVVPARRPSLCWTTDSAA